MDLPRKSLQHSREGGPVNSVQSVGVVGRGVGKDFNRLTYLKEAIYKVIILDIISETESTTLRGETFSSHTCLPPRNLVALVLPPCGVWNVRMATLTVAKGDGCVRW